MDLSKRYPEAIPIGTIVRSSSDAQRARVVGHLRTNFPSLYGPVKYELLMLEGHKMGCVVIHTRNSIDLLEDLTLEHEKWI